MINKISYKDCTLCQACINICPKKCIKLEEEKYGFLYPKIKLDECINCGLCEKVCPNMKSINEGTSLEIGYVAKNLNDRVREKSSSGGVFSAVAEYILSKDGVVFGVAMDEEFIVKHIEIHSVEELSKLRGSKYVQSDTENIYKQVKDKLDEGRKVLFSGCPCQVGGLKSFLNKEYENLYTLDFICDGVPSQKIFDEYRKYLEEKFNSKIRKFSFRDKTNGWHALATKVEFENDNEYRERGIYDTYMRGFLGCIYKKPACYNCKYINFRSESDLKIADLWGAEVIEKEIDDNKGLSLVIVNSKKGESILSEISKSIFLKRIELENAIKYNLCLIKPTKPNKKREEFFQLVNKSGYKKAFNKYCKEKYISKIKRRCREKLGIFKRSIIKYIK